MSEPGDTSSLQQAMKKAQRSEHHAVKKLAIEENQQGETGSERGQSVCDGKIIHLRQPARRWTTS
jgi:hypothetical protein